MKYKKKYVEVTAKFDTEGRVFPLKILWEDGSSYFIDKVLDVRPAASLKAGRAGIRYTSRINMVERFLFLEESRWFVEEILKD